MPVLQGKFSYSRGTFIVKCTMISVFVFLLPIGSLAVSYQCKDSYFQSNKREIITTEESIANGAVALKTLHASSLQSCEMACCKYYGCNVAIYETTTKNLCYLFNCGEDASLCEFKQHSRYTASIRISNRLKPFEHVPGELNVRVIKWHTQPTAETTATYSASKRAPTSSATEVVKDYVVRQGGPPRPPPTPPPPPPRHSLADSLADRYHQARATVIGLGVALALTIVAIVALGCRLRQLRSQFGVGRQGKLRSRMVDDEDYLINGMYL